MFITSDGKKLVKKPVVCGCKGCIFEDDPNCPYDIDDNPDHWQCVIDNCIYVEEE